MLIGVSRRSGEPGELGALDELAEPADRERRCRPAELSRDAVAELVGAELGEEAAGRIAAEVHRRSGGNPLFVGELIRATREAADSGDSAPEASPPQTVVNLVKRRVGQVAGRDPGGRPGTRDPRRLRDRGGDRGGRPSWRREAVLIGTDRLAEAELTDPGDPRQLPPPDPARGDRRLDPGRRARPAADGGGAGGRPAATRPGPRPTSPPPAPTSPAARSGPRQTLRRAAAAAGRAVAAARRSPTCGGPGSSRSRDRERREILLELGGLEAQARDYAALEHLAAAAELAADPVERGADRAGPRRRPLPHDRPGGMLARLPRGDRRARRRRARAAAGAGGDGAQRRGGARRQPRPARRAGGRGRRGRDAGERAVLAHVVADLAATGSSPAARVRELGRRALGGRQAARRGRPRLADLHLRRHRPRLGGRPGDRPRADHRGDRTGRRSGSLVAVSYSAALRAGTALLAGDLALAESDSELVVSELPGRRPDGLRDRPRLADRDAGRAQPPRGRPRRARAQRPDRRAAGAGDERLPDDGARPR